MKKPIWASPLIFCALFAIFAGTACTSPDDGESIMDTEAEELGDEIGDAVNGEMDEEFDDIGDGDGEDVGEDDLDDDDDVEDLAEEDLEDDLEDEDLDDEDLDDDDELADFEDEDEGLDELDEDDDDEFALDDDEDSDDDEDFDEDEDDEFALDEDDEDEEASPPPVAVAPPPQNLEQTLAQELAGRDQFDNPNGPSSPQFPQEQQVPLQAEAVIPPPQFPQDDIGRPDPIVPQTDFGAPTQSWIPVKKIKTEPFARNGGVLNTVYIARPGDSLRSISMKIYGSPEKTSTLEKNNSYLAGGVDPGDKIYYESPNRPGDSTPPIKVYYEDLGLQAKTYVTTSADDMRRLGAKLLGFQAGWKEIWAINPNVASKSALTPGLELRYWKGDEGTILAKNDPVDELDEPVFEEVSDPTRGQEVAAIEEDPIAEPFDDDLPMEPDLPEVELPEPEEPVIAANIGADPNNSGGPGQNASGKSRASLLAKNKQTSLMTVGALALVLIAVAALVAISIKNRKAQTAMPPSMEYTQV